MEASGPWTLGPKDKPPGPQSQLPQGDDVDMMPETQLLTEKTGSSEVEAWLATCDVRNLTAPRAGRQVR